ncbi:alpha-ketoglutarate-dependent dioxygenase AlkB family protein [Spongiimicrobium sp. 3-5]|uniref:alpha-ketoglutarate-dependent dioxygenase AlkB family protein n=1 Tax=Spongiimicrobium sp. 3-5 TaxID=3332596 RepID=UPI00397F8656
MDLFNTDPLSNRLPYDGNVIYYGSILSNYEASIQFTNLLECISWVHDEAVIYGKRIVTDRKVAWYGDGHFSYTYSGTTKQSLPWIPEIMLLKKKVEQKTGVTFNSCLLNLYHSGKEGMSWHSDNEKSLGHNTTIAAVSLGAERKLMFKHKKTKENTAIHLEHGSLLVMKDNTQENWLHSIPKTKKVRTPRISLTFRTFVGS